MCIIVVKPIGNTLSKKTLETCFTNNDDGAGFMWYNNDIRKVVGDKGYMTFQTLWNGLTRKGFTEGEEIIPDVGMVLHCRIATHGGVQAPLTHPFPITSNDAELRKLNWEADWGIAHNGTITGVVEWNSKTDSDTLAFVRDYLADEKILSLITHEPFIKLLSFGLKPTNRFAIFTPEADLILIGNFIQGQDGNIYSNSSFQERVRTYYYSGNQGTGYASNYNYPRRGSISLSRGKLTESEGRLFHHCTIQAKNCSICTHYKHYESTYSTTFEHYCTFNKFYLDKYRQEPDEVEETPSSIETSTTEGLVGV